MIFERRRLVTFDFGAYTERNCRDPSKEQIDLQIIMLSKQQKQIESEGGFQEIRDQVETLNTPNMSIWLKKKPTRHAKPSERPRLGLLQPAANISFCSSSSRPIPQTAGKIVKLGSVIFRSNFEGGHLGGAQQLGINNFRVWLDQESNSSRTNIWFDFIVEGARGQVKFQIDGFTKKRSLYSEGMKICCRDGGKWRRGGTHISYQLNTANEEESCYKLNFTYFFKNNEHSAVQFAYGYPYGASKLQSLVGSMLPFGKLQILGRTFQGRDIPLLSLGNNDSSEVIFVSSRVHPGETCSSWIMQGLLKELTSESELSKCLLQQFSIKVIPMINIDGVSRGNYRFSASGVDLNRKWKQPSQHFQPEIHYLKEAILKQSKHKKIRMFIDMHGHSRKKNVFFYGCAKNGEGNAAYARAKAFPYLMSKLHPAYNYFDCSFAVQKEKEGTARVTLWKQLKISEIFTLQASMCGSQNGGNYNQQDYQKIGRKLCEGIAIYFSSQFEKKTPILEKQAKFNEEILQSLLADEFLLALGNNQNSESESDPQKGENITKETSEMLRKPKSISLKESRPNSKNQNIKIKQKCETIAAQQKDLVKQKQLFEYLFSIPSSTLPHQKKFQPPSMFTTKRVSSLSRNNHYRTAIKSITYNDEQIYFGEQKGGRNKTNLLVGWEGAQYRRVRKVAEQNWRRESSAGDIQVKGIKSNKLEIENMRTLIPKLSTNIMLNRQRKTAQAFFKKQQQREQKLGHMQSGEQMNVLCRGRQIGL